MGVRDQVRRQFYHQVFEFVTSRRGRFLAVCLFAGTAVAGAAYASGLGLVDQSTDTVAHAYAGAGVNADPSIAYYNPAGMVLINGDQIEQSFNFYRINSHFTGNDTNAEEGTSVSGTAKGFVESTLVPGTFSVISLPYGLKAGLSVTVPVGGRLKYPANFAGEFEGQEALLTTIQLGLAIAIPITSQLSIGFGPEINWFENKLSLVQNVGSPPTPGTFSAKGYGLGFNVGALYRLDAGTRFGIDYRSKIHQKLKGTEKITPYDPFVQAIFEAGILPYDSTASDEWTFPQQVSFSLYQQVTSRLALMVSALWTNWAEQQNLVINDPSTAIFTGGAIYTPFKYRNTWTIGAGANYVLTPRLMLMTGAGYDESPIPKAYREDLLPDDDRITLGIGASYEILPSLTAEIAYQHIIIANGSISQTREGLAQANNAQGLPANTLDDVQAGTLTGQYKLSADVFSAGITGKF